MKFNLNFLFFIFSDINKRKRGKEREMTTREQTHVALERFRALTESLIEGIQASLQASRQQRNTHSSTNNQQKQQQQQRTPAVMLVKDFSPVIKALAECEKTVRDLVARARRQEQLQLQTDRVRDAIVRNEERLVAAVFFPAHEVDGRLRRAVNKSKFVRGSDATSSTSTSTSTDKKAGTGSGACTIDPESLSSYLSTVRFMAPPSMKLFRYSDEEMESYAVYRSAFVDEEYRAHVARSAVGGMDSGYAHKEEEGKI